MKSSTDAFANNAGHSPTKPIWVSPKEASRLTAIGLTKLYELMNDGTIKSGKVGRKRLVSLASLESLGESRRVDQ
jgi:excisionase family DNA binding protein